jgi:phosphoribosylanthranilate isomerase
MTRIKICGITNLRDARTAIELGADALGYIFCASARRIAPGQARSIIRELPPFVTAVGVFADSSPAEVNETAGYAGLTAVQLHGSESASDAAAIRFPVIRRIEVNEGDTAADIQARADDFPCRAFLLDPGRGSGRAFDWRKVSAFRGIMILAGGLTPENVAAAIRTAKPYGVDVCSGLETEPGRKDRDRIKKFIMEVRSCEK